MGPTLFSLFVNDLSKAITGATTLVFADITAIYAIGKDVASIAEALTSALHLASECDIHLSQNMQKTKTMLIHFAWRANPPSLSVHLLSTPVQQVHGVCINDTLTWHEQVQYVSATVSRNLNLLQRLYWFLPKAVLLSIAPTSCHPSTIAM